MKDSSSTNNNNNDSKGDNAIDVWNSRVSKQPRESIAVFLKSQSSGTISCDDPKAEEENIPTKDIITHDIKCDTTDTTNDTEDDTASSATITSSLPSQTKKRKDTTKRPTQWDLFAWSTPKDWNEQYELEGPRKFTSSTTSSPSYHTIETIENDNDTTSYKGQQQPQQQQLQTSVSSCLKVKSHRESLHLSWSSSSDGERSNNNSNGKSLSSLPTIQNGHTSSLVVLSEENEDVESDDEDDDDANKEKDPMPSLIGWSESNEEDKDGHDDDDDDDEDKEKHPKIHPKKVSSLTTRASEFDNDETGDHLTQSQDELLLRNGGRTPLIDPALLSQSIMLDFEDEEEKDEEENKEEIEQHETPINQETRSNKIPDYDDDDDDANAGRKGKPLIKVSDLPESILNDFSSFDDGDDKESKNQQTSSITIPNDDDDDAGRKGKPLIEVSDLPESILNDFLDDDDDADGNDNDNEPRNQKISSITIPDDDDDDDDAGGMGRQGKPLIEVGDLSESILNDFALMEDGDDEDKDEHVPTTPKKTPPIQWTTSPSKAVVVGQSLPKSSMKKSSTTTVSSSSLTPSLSPSLTPSSVAAPPKKITFGVIEARLYEIALEVNPSVSYGPAVGIGWKYVQSDPIPLDVYESHRPVRKNMADSANALRMSGEERLALLQGSGISDKDIIKAVHSVRTEQKHRQKALDEIGREPTIERWQAASRQIQNVLRIRRDSTYEEQKLWKKASKMKYVTRHGSRSLHPLKSALKKPSIPKLPWHSQDHSSSSSSVDANFLASLKQKTLARYGFPEVPPSSHTTTTTTSSSSSDHPTNGGTVDNVVALVESSPPSSNEKVSSSTTCTTKEKRRQLARMWKKKTTGLKEQTMSIRLKKKG